VKGDLDWIKSLHAHKRAESADAAVKMRAESPKPAEEVVAA
jgi:hypothetical protein